MRKRASAKATMTNMIPQITPSMTRMGLSVEVGRVGEPTETGQTACINKTLCFT